MTASRLSLVLVVLTGGLAQGQGQASIYQKATTGYADIGGSESKWYGGRYDIGGTSSICGEIPKESSLTGEAVFVVEFSGGGGRQTVTSIAFGSKGLTGSAKETNTFTLNVHVVTEKGGRPPAYVLNTKQTDAKTRSTNLLPKAMLTRQGGVTTLDIAGVNDANETITLRLTCK
jgi:hypothetical protein